MEQNDLTRRETHFAFGKNWSSYAARVSETEIKEAEKGLARLLGSDRLDGQRFLGIGCGSGVHSLAALRLGAKEIVALDIDPDSVATTRLLLAQHVPQSGIYRVEEMSVFDMTPEALGSFDTIYSWGVLHHTGDMYRALRQAAALVSEEGRFAFALYQRTWGDWFWKIEKRWYAHATPGAQARARAIYRALFRLKLAITGRRFANYVAKYYSNRGMDFEHDVHDWMGGWPYESINTPEVEVLMRGLNLVPERVFSKKGQWFGRSLGFFGSGCDEYVYRRL